MLTACCVCNHILDDNREPIRPVTQKDIDNGVSHGYCIADYRQARIEAGLPVDDK